MRLQLIFLFVFLSFSVFARESFRFPKIQYRINSFELAVPKGWHLYAKTYGDLNGDGLEDMAIIMEFDAEVSETRVYGDNHTDLIEERQKPRILAIYFKDKHTSSYILSAQNNNFILREKEGGVLGEPFKQFSINDNQLYLRFKGGSIWRWEMGYTFSFLDNNWTLTNAINFYYNHTTGAFTERIFDFKNRQLFTNLGNLHQRDSANQKTSEILFFGKLRTFDSFKKPWAWEVMPDVYL